VLAFQQDGTLVTGDHPEPVALGKLPEDVVRKFGAKMKPGLLLRFCVGPQGFYLEDNGALAGADLQWAGVANAKRLTADKYSRIVFQWQMRNGRVTFDALLAAVQANADMPALAPLPISDADGLEDRMTD
jgi:hypothetical protein